MKKILLFAAILSCSGCGHSKHDVWVHPNKSDQEFYRDTARCETMANSAGNGNGYNNSRGAMVGSSIGSAISRNRIYSNCMMGEGWNEIEVRDNEIHKKANPLDSKWQQIAKENNDRCDREEFKLLFEKSACSNKKFTLEQLSDKSTISETEKSIFSKYRLEQSESNNKLLEAIRTLGGPKDKEYGLILERIYLKSDQSALDLFEGKETWGEYNRTRKENSQILDSERNRIFYNK